MRRITLAWLVSGIAVLATTRAALAQQKVYAIDNAESGLSIAALRDTVRDNGGRVFLHRAPGNGTPDQRWTLQETKHGVLIRNKESGLALVPVRDRVRENGYPVVLWKVNGDGQAHQNWRLVKTEHGQLIMNVESELMLVPVLETVNENGGKLVLGTVKGDGRPYQNWKLREIPQTPEFTTRNFTLGNDESDVNRRIKEYEAEGWQLVRRIDENTASFKRRYHTAANLPNRDLLERLQGAWTVTALHKNGAAEDWDGTMTFTVDGNRHSTKRNGKVTQSGTIQYVRAYGNLLHIDLLLHEGQTVRSIIKVEGDTLKYVSGGTSSVRPKEFTTRRGDGYQYWVMSRER
jgi:uncharacterized protein (TIGR03067 family)